MTPLRRRVLAAVAFVAVLFGTVAAPAWASTGESAICTGFSACAAAGYTEYGYSSVYTSSHWSQDAGHNCTNYVGYRFERIGIGRQSWAHGGAAAWGGQAGGLVNGTPAAGAIAWWSATAGKGSGGHVAIVEWVNSDGSFVTSDDVWEGDFHWRTYSPGGSAWPSGFIHLNDAAMAASGVRGTPAPPPTPPAIHVTQDVTIYHDPTSSSANLGTIPSGTSPQFHCWTRGESVGGLTVWFSITYNGVTGYYASRYDDSSYGSANDIAGKYGIPSCDSSPAPTSTDPAPPPTPTPTVAPTPTPAPSPTPDPAQTPSSTATDAPSDTPSPVSSPTSPPVVVPTGVPISELPPPLVPGRVGKPRVTLTRQRVVVAWSPPAVTNGTITGYLVFVDGQRYEVPGTTTRVTFASLSRGLHTVAVAATNDNGRGARSFSLRFQVGS